MIVGAFVRLSAMLLALSLVLVPVGTGMRAASMITKAVPTVLNGKQGSSNSIGCSGIKSRLLAKACSLDCTGTVAVTPDVATIDRITAESRPYHALGRLAGLRVSPDPHPPKRIS